MASRYRTISRPAINLLKSTIAKPSTRSPLPVQSTRLAPPLFSRPMPQMGALLSLLPLHTAVSSARLTTCLGPNRCSSLSHFVLSYPGH